MKRKEVLGRRDLKTNKQKGEVKSVTCRSVAPLKGKGMMWGVRTKGMGKERNHFVFWRGCVLAREAKFEFLSSGRKRKFKQRL